MLGQGKVVGGEQADSAGDRERVGAGGVDPVDLYVVVYGRRIVRVRDPIGPLLSGRAAMFREAQVVIPRDVDEHGCADALTNYHSDSYRVAQRATGPSDVHAEGSSRCTVNDEGGATRSVDAGRTEGCRDS